MLLIINSKYASIYYLTLIKNKNLCSAGSNDILQTITRHSGGGKSELRR